MFFQGGVRVRHELRQRHRLLDHRRSPPRPPPRLFSQAVRDDDDGRVADPRDSERERERISDYEEESEGPKKID